MLILNGVLKIAAEKEVSAMENRWRRMSLWFFMVLIVCLGFALTAAAEEEEQISVLPGSLYLIEDGAFEGTALQSVHLSEGLEAIGDRAFAGNDLLFAVYIPESAQHIGQKAFDGADQVLISGDAGSYAQRWARENGYRFGFLVKIMNQRAQEAEKGFFPRLHFRGNYSEKQKTSCCPVQKAIRTGRTIGELKASHFKGIAAQHIQSRYFP